MQKRNADRKFLQKSLEIAYRIYSLHKGESNKDLVKRLKRPETSVVQVQPSAFLTDFVDKHGGEVRAAYAMVMTIPYMFKFHRKRKHEFLANFFLVERKSQVTL